MQPQPGPSWDAEEEPQPVSSSYVGVAGEKNNSVAITDVLIQKNTIVNDVNDSYTARHSGPKIVETEKKLTSTEMWSRILAETVEEMPTGIKEDFKLYVDAIATATRRGTWVPPTAESTLLPQSWG